MGVVLGEMVDDAGLAGVHVAAAEILRGDDLAGGGLHERWTTEEEVPWSLTMTVSSDIAGT